MKSKTQPEPVIPSTDETRVEDAKIEPTTRDRTYKTMFTVVVIGVLLISVLWWSVQHTAGNPTDSTTATTTTEPDVQAQENSNAKSPQRARIEEVYASLDRRLVSLSEQMERGFEVQHADSSDVMQALSEQTERLQAINTAIADLGKRNQVLDRRIREAISRLESLTQAVAALKVVTHKAAPTHKPHLAKSPPFQIDAIDIWDDAIYVAVSQAGRVAFLKTGEQQSGWTVTRIDRLKGQVVVQGPAGQIQSLSLPR